MGEGWNGVLVGLGEFGQCSSPRLPPPLAVSLAQPPGARSFYILKGVLEDHALRYGGGERPGGSILTIPGGAGTVVFKESFSGLSPAVPVRRLPLLKRRMGHFGVLSRCL